MKTRTMIRSENRTYGKDDFYLEYGGEKYWLFSQNHKAGVSRHFEKGLPVSEALSYRKANDDASVIKTITKLPMYIKYVEKEYGIAVLEKTIKKQACPGREKVCA